MNISDSDLAGSENFFCNVAGPGTFKLGGSGSGMNILDKDLAGPGNFFADVAGNPDSA